MLAMRNSTQINRFFLTGFIAIILPLFGFGCTGEKSPSSSVSDKSDTVQEVPDEPTGTDEKPATKPKPAPGDESPSETPPATTAQSELPEGWKWYENAQNRAKFGYPDTWQIAEISGNDGFYIFLADRKIQMTPEPATPITVQLTTDSFEQLRAELLRQDPSLISDTVQVNGKSLARIRYQSEVLDATEYAYGVSGAVLWHIDDPAVQQIANQMLSTYTQGDAP